MISQLRPELLVRAYHPKPGKCHSPFISSMAGNHNKKSSERRDSLKQQQRKNSGSSKGTANAKFGGYSNRAASTTPPPPSPLPSVTTHAVGRNGFNSAEVKQFLNQRFSNTLAAYHDTSLDASSRPEKYESQEKAWGNKGSLPSVWGQKSGTMASGNDLLTELWNQAKQ